MCVDRNLLNPSTYVECHQKSYKINTHKEKRCINSNEFVVLFHRTVILKVPYSLVFISQKNECLSLTLLHLSFSVHSPQ